MKDYMNNLQKENSQNKTLFRRVYKNATIQNSQHNERLIHFPEKVLKNQC